MGSAPTEPRSVTGTTLPIVERSPPHPSSPPKGWRSSRGPRAGGAGMRRVDVIPRVVGIVRPHFATFGPTPSAMGGAVASRTMSDASTESVRCSKGQPPSDPGSGGVGDSSPTIVPQSPGAGRLRRGANRTGWLDLRKVIIVISRPCCRTSMALAMNPDAVTLANCDMPRDESTFPWGARHDPLNPWKSNGSADPRACPRRACRRSRTPTGLGSRRIGRPPRDIGTAPSPLPHVQSGGRLRSPDGHDVG